MPRGMGYGKSSHKKGGKHGQAITSHGHKSPVKVSPYAVKSFMDIEGLNSLGDSGNTRHTSLKHGGSHK